MDSEMYACAYVYKNMTHLFTLLFPIGCSADIPFQSFVHHNKGGIC